MRPVKRLKLSDIPKTAEIAFDPSARSEYLTGFHKRKQARIKVAQDKAVVRDRAIKLRLRAEARQRRREELEEHVKAVNDAMRAANGLDSPSSDDDEAETGNGEWDGFDEPPKLAPINREDEYVDEEKYTTVKVSEVEISRTGFIDPDSASSEDEYNASKKDGNEESTTKPKSSASKSKSKPKDQSKTKKKKKFRYETKVERKISRFKERRKNNMQARERRGDK
jgi:ribosomal RNA-processing protein 17